MKAWFEQLAPRERLTLIIGLAVGLPLIFYVAVWAPLKRDTALLETNVAAQRETLAWMQSAAGEVLRLRASGAQAPQQAAGGSLLSIINQTAQRHELAGAIQRMNPQGERAIELQLNGVNFDRFVIWLGELESAHAMSVSSLSLNRTAQPGQVDIRLTLERPA